MTKTFKIGEYAIGGIIQVDIRKNDIEIKALDWNTKKVVSRYEYTNNDPALRPGYWRSDVIMYLEDLTTYYYAERIMKYIEGKL